MWDMASVLDEKRRVVLPKDMVEDLGLTEGTAVAFEERNGVIVMRKMATKADPLLEMMSWNPKRRGRPQPVREKEIKEIWR